MRLLLCTNGTEAAQPALDYGVWLAERLKAEVQLLGIVEQPEHRQVIERCLDDVAKKLATQKTPVELITEDGSAEQLIPAYTVGATLTIFGRLDRPGWVRVLRGRSVRRLLDSIETPLIYVPEPRSAMRRVLLCLGGLGMGAELVDMAVALIVNRQAAITVLHVIEPTTFEYPVADALHDASRPLLETDTPQARHLKAALDSLHSAGLEATLRLREGYVREEIVSELREGDYDLVGIGSHYSAGGLRPMFTPNVTGEVAEVTNCPMLVVRGSLPSL